LPKTIARRAQSTTTGEKVAEKVPEDSLSRVRRALEKSVEGKQEILVIRFSSVDEDEISGFLKTRDRKNEVFLTDFAAKRIAGGIIEYLRIGEERIRIAKGKRGLDSPDPYAHAQKPLSDNQ